ncbi:hypothetical protein KLAE6086_22310 [Klebsiella aerogenes]
MRHANRGDRIQQPHKLDTDGDAQQGRAAWHPGPRRQHICRIERHFSVIKQRLQPAGEGAGGGGPPAVAVDEQLDFGDAPLRALDMQPRRLPWPLVDHAPQMVVAEFVKRAFTVELLGQPREGPDGGHLRPKDIQFAVFDPFLSHRIANAAVGFKQRLVDTVLTAVGKQLAVQRVVLFANLRKARPAAGKVVTEVAVTLSCFLLIFPVGCMIEAADISQRRVTRAIHLIGPLFITAGTVKEQADMQAGGTARLRFFVRLMFRLPDISFQILPGEVAFGLRSARRQAAALVVFGFLLHRVIGRLFSVFIIRPGKLRR